ncbi:palindromic element RPE1 domain-containing protein [Candidatus Tisiphia endosymbiont of Empis tessellata]|uniref:palindromic element RPE1 domain-containing protein n=1 Tax=Candidatus Tisiphia endosymbiont of Empis tessellata TaxID=3066259 RepID=UPI003977AB5B
MTLDLFRNSLVPEGFEGDASPRTAAYSNVREDSSTASTYKSPAEVEFRRRSIEGVGMLGRRNTNS